MPKEEEDKIKELDRRLGEVEARLAAVAGLRETYDARFTLLTEKLGELRSMIIAQAKESADARVKAEKALASLEGIKPEEFRAFLMRRDAEIEGIKTRLITFEETVKSLRDEMKEYRETLARFKGLEAVLGMSEEARSNIVRIQQLRDQVEIASDKVMTAFMEFQRRLKDVTNLSLRVSRLEEMVKPLQQTVGRIEVEIKNFAPRSDLEKLAGELQAIKTAAEEIKKYHQSVSSEKGALEGIRAELKKAVEEVERSNSAELRRLERRLDVLEKAVSRILKILLSAK
jgi:predicted  nucleic acid-binding Zn-ribbon protein